MNFRLFLMAFSYSLLMLSIDVFAEKVWMEERGDLNDYEFRIDRCEEGGFFDRGDKEAAVMIRNHKGGIYHDDGRVKSKLINENLRLNLNGPSVIKFKPKDAQFEGYDSKKPFYMFFAHHRGRSIRLANASSPCGPWTVIKGPMNNASVNNISLDNESSGISDYLKGHIASPDAHVVDGKLVLFIHGSAKKGPVSQRSLVLKGDNFDDLKVTSAKPFNHPYLRDFYYNGSRYGIFKDRSLGNYVSRAENQNMDGDYEEDKVYLIPKMRHSAVHVKGDSIFVFYSEIGNEDKQDGEYIGEVLKVFKINTNGKTNPEFCVRSKPKIIMRSEGFERLSDETKPSKSGLSYVNKNELRDPAIFKHKRKLFLYYAYGAEGGLAGARLRIIKAK